MRFSLLTVLLASVCDAALRGNKVEEVTTQAPAPPKPTAEDKVLPADAAATAHASGGGEQGDGVNRRDILEKTAETLDSAIGPGEYKEIDLHKLIAAADKDKDGALSLEEIATVMSLTVDKVLPGHGDNLNEDWKRLVQAHNPAAGDSEAAPDDNENVAAGLAGRTKGDVVAESATIPKDSFENAVGNAYPYQDGATKDENVDHAAFIKDQIEQFGEMDADQDG